MPTLIYLLRHGETTWNIERRYQGALDSPLSAEGRDQSLRLREALRSVPVRAVYSSPLERALTTAEVIAQGFALPVIAVPDLAEIRVGEWEGLLVGEIEARYPEAAHHWYNTPHLARIPGGETIEELRARAVRATETIRRRHNGEHVMVVAHGGVNKTILLTALGAPLENYWRIRQHNACINLLEYEGDRVRVVVLNETIHLDN